MQTRRLIYPTGTNLSTTRRETRDESFDAPTFTPSIRVTGVQPLSDEELDRVLKGEKIETIPLCCHSFVTDGKIQFLGDCTHKLVGQVVDIPEWE